MYDTKTPVDSVWYKKPDYNNKNPDINVGTYNRDISVGTCNRDTNVGTFNKETNIGT